MDIWPGYWTLTAIAVFSYVFHHILSSRRQSKKGVFPPGPKPLPFIGNVLDLITAEPWLMYMRWEKEFNSKIFNLTIAGKRMFILNSLEDVVELLEKRAGIYSDRVWLPLVEMSGWTFNTGLMPHNERWKQERRIFQQTFKRESVAQFQPTQSTKVHTMLRQLLVDPENFAAYYKTLSAAVILDIMYGYEVQPKNDHIIQVVQRAIRRLIENGDNPSVAALNAFPVLRHLPRWFPGTEFHKIVDDCREYTQGMLNIPFEYVRTSIREGSLKESVVRTLLETNIVGEESVKGIAGTAFSAGTDTVLSALECFFFAMALHPEKQRKAQAEIDRIVGSDRLPTFRDRDSLPYVEAIYREMFRWLPPFPMTVPHVAQEEDVYQGYYIPKGTVIFPNVWAITHDKTKYKDPDSFIPERFFDDGKLNDDSRVLGFGFGRRLCPGQYLASATVWLSMVTVLAAFDIGLPYDLDGNLIKTQRIYVKADALHLSPYKCSITPRSTNARKLIEATEYTAGY
ncbi:cytochrome P450 [Macrolepiota fuliginosa MF-IS2]|uniref:Cytochrome P450 n=1 Tax=Macrolepiota fuliginosa MF-IS2 TaxID=1400762 RepID=A0A9P5XD90_9AGAR|nr:cytochrome P450 [Macrolepiota fuliginosa MF-IS2]